MYLIRWNLTGIFQLKLFLGIFFFFGGGVSVDGLL